MYRYVDAGVLRLSARPAGGIVGCPDLDGAAGSDAELLEWLDGVWSDPSFASAVEVASPALAAQVPALLAAAKPCPRSIRRATISTLRYLLRTASRATPFGLFAGVAPLRIESSTRVEIGTSHRAVARVGHQWIAAAVDSLLRCPGVADKMTVAVDGRAFVRDSRLVLPGQVHTVAEVSVRLTRPVAAVLAHTRDPVVLHQLRDHLVSEFPGVGVSVVDGMLPRCWPRAFSPPGSTRR